MIASILRLSRSDIKKLRVKDDYSLHRVVFNLFEDCRSESEKKTGCSSGILYVDKGGNWQERKILILSNRPPSIPEYGRVESKKVNESFLSYDNYQFEVAVNPCKRDIKTGKVIPIKEKGDIIDWFLKKAKSSWGIEVNKLNIDIKKIGVKSFEKKGHHVTYSFAIITGQLFVIQREEFIKSFQGGLGRGKAFGFGLLQLKPLINLN